jgi:UDP-GlcNAc:undecaprenyl-phosphate GlcNAc-1-phosphate transferase
MSFGFHARGIDCILYTLQIILGVLVFVSMLFKGALSLVFLGAAYAVPFGFFVAIHFINRRMPRDAVNTAETASGSG